MEIDWNSIERILVVRLRSIGDTVLSTPSLQTLREFTPKAKIDILLEDWVAPVLDGFSAVDEVISVSKHVSDRISTALELRKRRYDVVFNLHGGTTSAFLMRATGAPHRIGYDYFQCGFLYTHRFPTASGFWKRKKMHTAEHQIALFGYAGIPVEECPKSSLAVTESAAAAIDGKLTQLPGYGLHKRLALIHPAAAYDSKRWSADNFSQIIKYLQSKDFNVVAIAAPGEEAIIEEINTSLGGTVPHLSNLSLSEVNAFASKADLFVGNDSGIAHIAAAVQTPSVVIFGSSSIDNWRPWTDAPHRVVSYELDCQPCPGDICRAFDKPKCILSVEAEKVIDAINEILL